MSEKAITPTVMKPEEMLYTYSESNQISMQTGLVGYLRCDMGRDGDEFWSTWNEFRADYNTQEFKDDIDNVINSLREKGNLLSNLSSISKAYHDMPESHFKGSSAEAMEYFGVRVNTEDYAFLMRLTPRRGEYNLYCYCYRKNFLDSHIEKAQRGIRFINSHYKEQFRIPDGDRIRIEYPDGSYKDRTCRYIDDYHLEVDKNLYHICEFAERMEGNGNKVFPLRSTLPDHCYIYVETENKIGIVKKGESGYYKTDILESNNIKSHDEAKAFVDELNEKLSVTPAQHKAMMAGSMFGWHTPAADPKSYDENGQPNKPKHKDRER